MAGAPDQVPQVTLRPEVEIPQLGFGVFQVPPKETEEVVARALQAGYKTEIQAIGSITFPWSEFNMTAPSIGGFVNVNEQRATMELDLVLRRG
jgi:hypothetical protein